MRHSITFFILCISFCLNAQNDLSNSSWHIQVKNIDPNNYYGVTMANGMIGIISSPDPMRIEDVVLNGVYDYYQRGRVSNILKTFNHLNMNLDIDGHRISIKDISNYSQTLDMKNATLTTTFDVSDKVSVKHKMLALRHMPFTALTSVEITAKKSCNDYSDVCYRSSQSFNKCQEPLR